MESIIKKTFNVKELANYLGVSEQLIYKMNRNGEIPSFTLGDRKILFSKDKIDLWIHNQEINNMQNKINETEVKSIGE